VEYPLRAPDSELPLLSIASDFSSPTPSSPTPSHCVNPCDTLDVLELSSDPGSDWTSSTSWLVDLDEQPLPSSPSPPHPTSSPIAATAPRKGLHSYFPTVHLGKRSGDDKGQILTSPPKRARIQPPLSPQLSLTDMSKKASQPLNKPGKSAANKLELNKAVAAGTFKRDKCKWAKFKSKISDIDPHSEVDDDNPKRSRDVLHVKCGKLIRMATVYDVSLYKRHVQNCKSRTARAGMHTLDHGLNFVFLRQDGFSPLADSGAHNDTSSLWPCPGLSKDIDPQIENYLLRTTVPSAGGTRFENVACNMYNKAYKDLTEEERQAVRIGQMHTLLTRTGFRVDVS
jgi:hypothetical protein